MISRVGRVIAVAVVGVASLGVQNADARATKTTFELRPVLAPLPAAGTTSTTLAPADRVDAGLKEAMCDEAGVAQLAVVLTTPLAFANATDCVVFPAWPGRPSSLRYYLGPAALSNRAVKRARAELDSGAGWFVKLTLTQAGAAAWDQLAEEQFHQQVAMVLGGTVLSAPTIQPDQANFTSFQGTAIISGAFTGKQARAVAAAIRAANSR